MLSAGRDFDKSTTPLDVGLDKFVNMQKGDFIGKESILKKTKNYKVMGMRVKNGIACLGSKIIINKQCIGEVTSSSWSPYQECGVSIVRLINDYNTGDLPVEVYDYKNNKLKGYICDLPMYDKNSEIVRGIDNNIPQNPNPWFK